MFSLKKGIKVPFGRQEWNVVDSDETALLSFNPCKYSEFACDNGACLNKYLRYNYRIVELLLKIRKLSGKYVTC